MKQEKPGTSRKKWPALRIVQVGGIALPAVFGSDGNVRDSQGLRMPEYNLEVFAPS